jgi:hypothetical protein
VKTGLVVFAVFCSTLVVFCGTVATEDRWGDCKEVIYASQLLICPVSESTEEVGGLLPAKPG